MFGKVRNSGSSYSSSSGGRKKVIETGEFVFRGVHGSYSVIETATGDIKVHVSYNHDEISTYQVQRWESDCKIWVKNQLSDQYYISFVTFY